MNDLASNTVLCDIAFGIKPSQIYAAVKKTNGYYGGRYPKTSRLLFVNGQIDPCVGANPPLSLRSIPANPVSGPRLPCVARL